MTIGVASELLELDEHHRRLRDSAPSTDHLDVTDRERTSVFPWRGQFSPQFVERMLSRGTKPGETVLDPFAGSGTSLVESARLGLRAVGVEANPAAFLLASSLKIMMLDADERSEVLRRGRHLLDTFTGRWHGGLFGQPVENAALESLQRCLREQVTSGAPDAPALLVAVAAMLGAGKTGHVTEGGIAGGWDRLELGISRLPNSSEKIDALFGDARSIRLQSDSVDRVFTSPPYINVFNYHQNYRKAVEWLGLSPLAVAPSEIGSNRKHRQNRFLTVFQYPMDMALAIAEMARVAKPGGTLILVVGRESNVRGVPIENGLMLSMVAEAACGLPLLSWEERSFTSRYGGRIWEDLLTLGVPDEVQPANLSTARDIGKQALESVSALGMDEPVYRDVLAALDAADQVTYSPALPGFLDVAS